MNDTDPKLSAVEQEVLLCAREGEALFHVLWGYVGVAGGPDRTEEEVRPDVIAVIRKLIDIGWVRLAEAWQDEVPPYTAQPPLGGPVVLHTLYREEQIPVEEFDRVLCEPASWEIGRDHDVILTTTAAGDDAVGRGVIDEAYAKFIRPKEGPSAGGES